ncbi:MAG: type II toxin-antitoxin system PemK/MazF family toxin [Chloroflexi bacterium]|nr:MAG: type II toxin-antitoxin system PemK/MazF family toxin [Chloroflexota bacterium]
MQIRRGDVFFCNLDPTFGHEQRGTRPVVVLQNDIANDKLNTVMVAPLTSNLKAKGYLLTVFVEAKHSGLPKDSVILLFQIRTIDKRRLERKITHLDDTIMKQVDRAIHIAFAL